MKAMRFLMPRLMQTASVDGEFAQSILEKYGFTRSAYLGRFALVFRDPESGEAEEESQAVQNIYQMLMNVRLQLEHLQHEESPYFVTKMQTLNKLEQVLVQQSQFLLGATRLQQDARRNDRQPVIRERVVVPQPRMQRTVETTFASELFDRYREAPEPELLQQLVRERVEQSMRMLRDETAVTAERVEVERQPREEGTTAQPAVDNPKRGTSFVQLTDEFVQRLRQEGLVRQEGYEDVSRPLLHRAKQEDVRSETPEERERARQELTRTVQEVVQHTQHEHVTEAVQQIIHHIRREDISKSTHHVLQRIRTEDLSATVREIVQRTKREDLTSAMQEIVERTKQDELSSAVQEIVQRTKQDDLNSAVHDIVQRTRPDDLFTAVFEVVQRTRQEDLTRAVQELVQRTQQDDLSSAVQQIVQRTKQESLANAVLEIVQQTKQEELSTAVHEVILRTGQEQLASAVQDIVLHTKEEHLTDALKEVVQRTKQEDLTHVMLEIVQHAKQDNVTTALREMVQRTTQEDLRHVVHELTQLAQQDVLTDLVKEIVQRTQDEIVSSAKQQLVQQTLQETVSLTVQEILTRIEQDEITTTLHDILQNTQVEALTAVVQEVLQRSEQVTLIESIEQAVENSQSIVVTRIVQDILQSTLQEEVISAVQEIVQHTVQNQRTLATNATLQQTSPAHDANTVIVDLQQNSFWSPSLNHERHANLSLEIVRDWQQANSTLVIDPLQQAIHPFQRIGRTSGFASTQNAIRNVRELGFAQLTQDVLERVGHHLGASITQEMLQLVEHPIGFLSLTQVVMQRVGQEFGLIHRTPSVLQQAGLEVRFTEHLQHVLQRVGNELGFTQLTHRVVPSVSLDGSLSLFTGFVDTSQVFSRGTREQRVTHFVEDILRKVEQVRISPQLLGIATLAMPSQVAEQRSIDIVQNVLRQTLMRSLTNISLVEGINDQTRAWSPAFRDGVRVLLHNTQSQLQTEQNTINRLLHMFQLDPAPAGAVPNERVRETHIFRVREAFREQVEHSFHTLLERLFTTATTRQNQTTRLVTRFIRRVTESTLVEEKTILDRVGHFATLLQTRILPLLTVTNPVTHTYLFGPQALQQQAGFTGRTALVNEMSQITNFIDQVVQQPGNSLVAPNVPGTRIHHRFQTLLQAVNVLQSMGSALAQVPAQDTRHAVHHLISNSVRAITNQIFHTNAAPLTYQTWLTQRVDVTSGAQMQQIGDIVQQSGRALQSVDRLHSPLLHNLQRHGETGLGARLTALALAASDDTNAPPDALQVPLRQARRGVAWQDSGTTFEFLKRPKKAEEPKSETTTSNVKQITLPEKNEKATAPTTANLSSADMERIVSKVYRELEEKLESEMKSRGF